MHNYQSIPSNKLWGAWASIGFTLIAIVAFIAVSMIVGGIFVSNEPQVTEAYLESLEQNGYLLALAQIPSALIAGGLLVLFAHIRLKNTLYTLKQYFFLHPITLKQASFWIAVIIIFSIIIEILNYIMDRPIPEFMIKTYETAENYPLFFFAIVIAAPIFEELVFRGFLFEGLRYSKIGVIGTILITSSIWASFHIQYGLFEIVAIFIIGIIFGIAKIKTNSLYIPIILHIFMNGLALALLPFQYTPVTN